MLYGNAVLIYIAFILGLLLSGLTWGGAGLIILGLIIAVLRWKRPNELLRRGPQPFFWLVWGLVGCLATFYLQWRVPQPAVNEVGVVASQINPSAPTADYVLTAKVDSLPRVTRSDRQQVWVKAEQLSLKTRPNTSASKDNKPVSGKVYVTYEEDENTQLRPGQSIKLEGKLYRPRASSNPGSFDFEAWLRRQSTFSGFNAKKIEVLTSPKSFGLWQVRERILNAQQSMLKGSAGPLIGAMVLGGRAVDLPFETQDSFIQVGMAHALAASGFQVSLILACIIALLRSFPNSVKFGVGSAAILVFLGLSGADPSVFRAVLMGFAGLVSLVLGRKMKPIPILILIAFLMLIVQPLWIWDLGFQLSFLATLGLIVTVPALQASLDWMPVTLSSLVAVPIAAMIWTLPLQLHNFGVIPTYSLIANILAIPLLSIVTLGGFISGIIGFILPPLGGLIAYFVGFPAKILLWLVATFDRLPGRTWAVGSISAWQVVIVYAVILGIWLLPKVRKRSWILVGCTLLALFVPVWSAQAQLSQLTLFDAGQTPILVLRQPRSTILINSGNEQTCQRTVLPFLQHQGVNQIELGIATDLNQSSQAAWEMMQNNIYLSTFSPVSEKNPLELQERMLDKFRKMRWQPLQPNQSTRVENASIRVLRNNPALIEFQFQNLTGLMVNDAYETGLATWLKEEKLPQVELLWITNSKWRPELVDEIKPQVIVLSDPSIKEESLKGLEAKGRKVYWTTRDGAVQWESSQGFSHIIAPGDGKSPLL